MNDRKSSKEQKDTSIHAAIPPRPKHLPTSFYGRELGTRTRPGTSDTGAIIRRMSDPAISSDDSHYLTDFFTPDSDLLPHISKEIRESKDSKESPKATPSPRSSPVLEVNTVITRQVPGSFSPSSATSRGTNSGSGLTSTPDLSSGISSNSSPTITTQTSFDSPDHSSLEEKLDDVPEELSGVTPRKEELVSEGEEDLATEVQNEILERVLKESTFPENKESSSETTQKVIKDTIADVWEQNLEVLSLAAMANSKRPVGIYYNGGLNLLKTADASIDAVIGEMGFAPQSVALLNINLAQKAQSVPVIWLDDLDQASKAFTSKNAIIFIPLYYYSSEKRLSQEAFQAAISYFTRSKNCEVIVYIPNEQDQTERLLREEWLLAKQKFLHTLSKPNIKVMNFSDLEKTEPFVKAEAVFLDKLVNLSNVVDKLYYDVVERLKKTTAFTFLSQRMITENNNEEHKEKEFLVEVVKTPEQLAIEKLTIEKQNEAQNKILIDKKGLFLIQDNPDPSEETIKNVMRGYSTHIWEENLEILALAAMASSFGRPVGIYYKKGINDIRTVVATGEAADGEEGFAAGRVATLNADLNEQHAPVVWYNNLTGARKVFDFKKDRPIIFIPICYTSAPGHRLENKEFESVVNYFARSRNCDVIVYLGRDAGLPANILKREEWLAPHKKYITSMLKYNVEIMHRAKFVTTKHYLFAEKTFITRFINRDKVSQKFCEDIILRMEQKKQLPTKRTSPTLNGMPPTDKRRMSPQKIKTVEEVPAPEIKADPAELPTQASPSQSPRGFLFSQAAFFSEVKSAKTEDEVVNLALFAKVYSGMSRGGKTRGVSRNLASQFMASSSQTSTETNHAEAQTESPGTTPRQK